MMRFFENMSVPGLSVKWPYLHILPSPYYFSSDIPREDREVSEVFPLTHYSLLIAFDSSLIFSLTHCSLLRITLPYPIILSTVNKRNRNALSTCLILQIKTDSI